MMNTLNLPMALSQSPMTMDTLPISNCDQSTADQVLRRVHILMIYGMFHLNAKRLAILNINNYQVTMFPM